MPGLKKPLPVYVTTPQIAAQLAREYEVPFPAVISRLPIAEDIAYDENICLEQNKQTNRPLHHL
jgi:hypothetical protein